METLLGVALVAYLYWQHRRISRLKSDVREVQQIAAIIKGATAAADDPRQRASITNR